ncbi:PCI domain-containing protein 2 -like protein [Trichinella pseudospiralis]|uniref:PCI domain-containing protein 2-like protein n=1 Tax=Trichinella pseudospiralis TaxID=6337 RepID=A0A0V1FHP7_TRIPS|nr:PCI domain-containing protein 2 -like protein [Trichinella pseudospiralis]
MCNCNITTSASFKFYRCFPLIFTLHLRVNNAFDELISKWGHNGTYEYGKLIKRHLSFHCEYNFLQNLNEDNISVVANQYFHNPFNYIFHMHLNSVICHAFKRYSDGFQQQLELVKAFNSKVLQKTRNENWFMPICCQFCKNLVVLAKLMALNTCNNQEAADAILQCYQLCQAELQSDIVNSKEIGLLSLTNCLCELFFKLGQIDDCSVCIEFIIKNNSLFDKADKVDKIKYKCYCGQLFLLKWNFKEAEESFTFALKNVPERYKSLRQIIVKYLIPTGILLGKVPSKKLLETYDLMFFHEFIVALRNGNISQLSSAIESNGISFAKLGISFLLHAFPSLCYRRIVRIIARILGTKIIPLQYLYCAFKLSTEGRNVISIQNCPITHLTDNCDRCKEYHCILINLIAKGNINASISTADDTLVLSDSISFPSLSEAIYTNPLFLEELA